MIYYEYEIMKEFLELLKSSELNDEQKMKMLECVETEKAATRTQKDRFCLYYGLNRDGKKDMNYAQIARIYNCTLPAVKYSIISMKKRLRKNNKNIKIIEEILEEYKSSFGGKYKNEKEN